MSCTVTSAFEESVVVDSEKFRLKARLEFFLEIVRFEKKRRTFRFELDFRLEFVPDICRGGNGKIP